MFVTRGCGAKEAFLHWWWECKLAQPQRKTVWKLLKKIKIELPYDPAIPFLDIYQDKTVSRKDTCILMFIAAPFIITKHGNNLNVHGQMHGYTRCGIFLRNIYTMEYYSTIGQNEIMPSAATRMDLEMITLSEASQKDKYHVISLLHRI